MSAAMFDGTWDLPPADRLLIEAKRWGSRLRFAVMLLFFRARGPQVVTHLAFRVLSVMLFDRAECVFR